ncbi:unnamed protein product [Aphis gossypii]|uniref:Uncharacterized protein n=1 Tax=Aphis gossypii TaxID=80765 RepID=A0A9P0NJV5_APHGO|nr:unnamed protein product [Aphis gossypii]
MIVKKPCSTLKHTMGKAFLMILKAFNMPSTCPIPVGAFTTSGLDMMDLIESHNYPKVFFYGKYKAVGKLKNIKNQVVGCLALEFTLLRPWEKPF